MAWPELFDSLDVKEAVDYGHTLSQNTFLSSELFAECFDLPLSCYDWLPEALAEKLCEVFFVIRVEVRELPDGMRPAVGPRANASSTLDWLSLITALTVDG